METVTHTGPAPVFDRDHLARYTGADAELEAELFGLLRDQAERCVSAMQAASEIYAWQAAAHTLKGAARGVGAFQLAEACERAETASPGMWPAAVSEVRAAAKRTFDEIARVLEA
ncbi:MAG: hypothetical protein CMF74_06495 [Maricaulis sp.]|jgi:chemotaxis protein histidine kinase CheA|nr:hypothetical protein [Maricaulis sp.]HAQ34479.1 Hpt domain-containing protein [Alphaproteobacteria bacterium]